MKSLWGLPFTETNLENKVWKFLNLKLLQVWIAVAGWKKGKRKWLQKSVLLSTSICCASYSYGVSQPCLYLSLGYFFKKIPSQRRIVIKSYNPVPNNENGRAENWTKSIKLRSYTFQGKFKREYNIYFGELCWQLHFDWEFFCCMFFHFSFSLCVCMSVWAFYLYAGLLSFYCNHSQKHISRKCMSGGDLWQCPLNLHW